MPETGTFSQIHDLHLPGTFMAFYACRTLNCMVLLLFLLKFVTCKVTFSKGDMVDKNTGEPDFYAKIHDRFMSELHDHILDDWGIDISNIRIESLRIHDKKLASLIANQAIQVSELEAKHMMVLFFTNKIRIFMFASALLANIYFLCKKLYEMTFITVLSCCRCI